MLHGTPLGSSSPVMLIVKLPAVVSLISELLVTLEAGCAWVVVEVLVLVGDCTRVYCAPLLLAQMVAVVVSSLVAVIVLAEVVVVVVVPMLLLEFCLLLSRNDRDRAGRCPALLSP